MANYILFDCPIPDDFFKSLGTHTRADWIPLVCDGRIHLPKWRRLLNYFIFPLRFILRYRHNIDNVIAWQQFYGLMLAFYNRLFRIKCNIIILTFIFKAKPGISGNIFHWFVNKALTAGCVKAAVVFSSAEIEYYRALFPKAADKFKFVHLGIPTDELDGIERGDADYIFSTGISNRDYEFLINTLDGSGYQVVIACSGMTCHGKTNVVVEDNLYGADMLRKMADCRVVVVPLKDRNISSGQLVILQAMHLGKPVVATDCSATRDYITHGVNGYLVNSPGELIDCINRFYSDNALYNAMGLAARAAARDMYSLDGYAIRVADIFNDSLKL